MVQLTEVGQWFAGLVLLSEALTAITSFSVVMLVLFQLTRDTKGQAFAALVFCIGCFGLMNCVIDIVGRLDPPHLLPYFNMAAIALSTIPLFTLIFVLEFLIAWTFSQRIVVRLIVIYVFVVAVFGSQNLLFPQVSYFPNGTLERSTSTIGLVLLALGEIINGYSFLILLTEIKRASLNTNRRLFLGLILLHVAGFAYITDILPKFSVGANLYTLSVLILAGPVLQQRLFDPLTQLNRKLSYRAEQLSAITRVGQHITAFLTLDNLLQVMVEEIQQTFDYYAVAVYLYDGTQEALILRAAAGTFPPLTSTDSRQHALDITSLVGAAAVLREVVMVADVRKDSRFAYDALFPQTLSEVTIPLFVRTSEEKLVGVLDIESDQLNAFSAADIEVLQILARQIAIAIRNAELFEEAQQANAAKTQFITYMSHEIRNPVSNILHTTEFVLNFPETFQNIPLPEAYRLDIVDVEYNAQLLKKLVDEVLDLAKIEAGKMEIAVKAIDPLPILEQVHQNALITLQNGVEFRTAYSTSLPAILADDLRLTQVLTNIVGNAVKFTTTGSITLSVYPETTMLHFAVADTGPGISPQVLESLFTPYLQGSQEITREFGGTGLGLHISKRFIELQNGRIWVESQAGQGTTFHFTLPLADPTLADRDNVRFSG
ncbi:MAG: ATP-binding protein [Chloroflexota bacterium]